MGTNYYWYEKDGCSACGRDFEPLHIGKSSGGWCFSLHVYPDKDINTLKDWQLKYRASGIIKDEYGDIISSEEIDKIITNRVYPHSRQHMEECGFDFDTNCAEPGPNNLARYKIDSRHCIGHGEGTWDYLIGYFS